ncbi:MAG: branched-chain amino acid ABC transporter permease, partial [Armatimonadetes bacterium]|nr:branched-chain amino acid ABC transporter permease [Armatimonadota bacterium]
MDTFLQQLINGLTLGSVYALIALGYTMVYGVLKLINFAHSDVYMLGAYAAFFAITLLHLPLFPALILSMSICALIGMSIEKFAYRPLRAQGGLTVLITAMGVSLFLENLGIIIFGA